MLKLNQKNERSRGNTSSGFSLIELLIVVAIILIIAAIAIPSLIRARMAANQASGVESCRTITTADTMYNTLYGGYAPSLNALGGPPSGFPTSGNAQLIDDALSTGFKSGYAFTYVGLNPDVDGNFQNYALNADPVLAGVSGVNHYFTNQPAVIHVNTSAKASQSDPPIE
jgi:type IV pilus assembly protein PilA